MAVHGLASLQFHQYKHVHIDVRAITVETLLPFLRTALRWEAGFLMQMTTTDTKLWPLTLACGSGWHYAQRTRKELRTGSQRQVRLCRTCRHQIQVGQVRLRSPSLLATATRSVPGVGRGVDMKRLSSPTPGTHAQVAGAIRQQLGRAVVAQSLERQALSCCHKTSAVSTSELR